MSDEDISASVSIDTWGPAVWSALHSLSFSYPIACETTCPKRMAMLDFLTSLKELIPCAECRGHYSEWFSSNISHDSPVLDGRQNLSEAIFNLHNEVNARTGKPLRSLADVKKKYLSSSASCQPSLFGGGGGNDGAATAAVAVFVGAAALVAAVVIVSSTSSKASKKSKK